MPAVDKIEFRNRWTTYLCHILFIYLCVVYAIRFSTFSVRFTLIALTCLGLVSLINCLVRRNYFEIKGNKLVINFTFFFTRSIELKDINRVEIESRLFFSKIYLHSGRTIWYSHAVATEAKVKELLGQFNIPVE